MWKDFYDEFIEYAKSGSGNMVSCKCPNPSNHPGSDKKPSGSVDFNTGVYYCHVCGSFNPNTFLVFILGWNRSEANNYVEAYAIEKGIVTTYSKDSKEDDGLVTKWKYDPSIGKFYESLKDNDPAEHLKWYCETKNLVPEVVLSSGVRFASKDNFPSSSRWKRDCLVFPYHIGNTIVGLRYRDLYGNKGAFSGSYFAPWGLCQLDRSIPWGLILEGETDRLSLLSEAHRHDLNLPNVLGMPRSDYRLEFNRELQTIQDLIIIPQSDVAAKVMIENAKKHFNGNTHVLNIPWQSGQIGKDLDEFFSYEENDFLEFYKEIQFYTAEQKTHIYVGSDFFDESTDEKEDYIIDNLLESEQIVLLGGPQKAMKTMLALEMIRTMLFGGNLADIEQFKSVRKIEGNALIIEEEGKKKDLSKRITKIFEGQDYEDRLVVFHRAGVKLDQDLWYTVICNYIEKHNIDVLLIDPLQRVHSKDEDNSSQMAVVWDTIHKVLNRFSHLVIIIIHHFTKAGNIKEGWKSLRGTSRNAGEADVGLFAEKWENKDGKGMNIAIDGRSIEEIHYPEGRSSFKLKLDTNDLRLKYMEFKKVVQENKVEQIANYLLELENNTADIDAIETIFNVSKRSIDRYIEKHPFFIKLPKDDEENKKARLKLLKAEYTKEETS